ncbi:alanine--tRNA ligase [Paraeggerthella hongkongensis]|uniref:Alanine--tRNA ligase n=1 Tax=Paraeggerthella hongkongensis TaxID=230658 RepID=A0A3N0BKS3_9ACTN|nr:alanine--tRNA ligase [Paraeggerthella hongkongensis]RNL49042.1 alanine--tRNA ligase [Paraeggerthella hongkongensis]
MKYMTSAEIREKYLSFFEEKGCKRWPSSSLIPDDPSLLLTSAGMVQFKPYFLQQKHLEAPYIGTTTVQKCVRTNDIEIIGTTGRHQSFFEMLGNFSFGEYFKEEMCAWAYEFSTEVLGLPAERLYFTVFLDDDETIEIWKKLGVPDDHISRLGEDDNFWRAGPTGPCGPCSEIYFDQGEEFGCGSPDCAPGCDCDRFLEYWNCVFTQYDGQEDGTLKPLPKKNIDTGMGLERMAAIMQGVQSNYETDVLRSLVGVGEKLTGTVYGDDPAADLSLRIMADHSRAVAFMIADGILPSNEGRGYVLRRLLRRAVMKGHLLGLDKPFLNEYVDEIVSLMGHVYPEIVENRQLMGRIILSEEERFGANLRQGRAFLDDALAELEGTVLPGDQAFTLHDTYGFPVEVTRELCEERGIQVDMDGFGVCMEEQRNRARAANTKDAEAAWSTYGGVMAEILEAVGPTEFVGYAKNESDARVLAIVKDGQQVDALAAGEEGRVVLDVTPFYAEKGGQIGDVGALAKDDAVAAVLDTKEPEKGLIAHAVKMMEDMPEGRIQVGDTVRAAIDAPRRERIRRNHTATHILHWALREVLGDHVKQAGSLVAENRLRFDFTHFEAMTAEQIAEVERLANQKIMENHAVRAYETSLASAREAGVMALFGEKYGEFVRVLDIEGFSQELCGGTHVSATSEIGFVKVTSESSVGANLRRIEAVTSFDALAYMNRVEAELKETAEELRVPIFDVSERVAANAKQVKELQAKMKRNRQGLADDAYSSLLESAVQAKGGFPVVIGRLGEADAGQMRNMWDVMRARMSAPGAVVLAGEKDGSPILLAAGAPEAVEAGFDAGAVIKAISSNIKGGGGGKAAMAQAGGKDASGIDAALDAAREMLL